MAHELGQVMYPGESVEVYSPKELAAVTVLKAERASLDRALDLLQDIIAEEIDSQLALKHLGSARKSIEVLEDYFSTRTVH
jgi:hypothetical protein